MKSIRTKFFSYSWEDQLHIWMDDMQNIPPIIYIREHCPMTRKNLALPSVNSIFTKKWKKYQSKLPGAQMNPWPSLSKTLNASLISSSISVSWISLKNKRNFESCKFSKNCSPSHEPDKLIETYWAIPILVDLSNQLLKNKI